MQLLPANWYWIPIGVIVLLIGVVWGWGGVSYGDDGDED